MAFGAVIIIAPTMAQNRVPDTQASPPPAIQNAPPEKMGEPLSTGSMPNLSDQLNKSDGVIRPAPGMDPGIAAPAPDPNPESTIVVPPPGTPGGDQSVVPK